MKFPFEQVVLDGGVIIELLLLGEDLPLYEQILDEKVMPFCTIFAIMEAGYILCRRIGAEKSFSKVDALVSSNYIEIISLDNLIRDISTLKCNNAIAIPDCATIALATKNGIPALFANKEQELHKPLANKAFGIEIYFLEEILKDSNEK